MVGPIVWPMKMADWIRPIAYGTVSRGTLPATSARDAPTTPENIALDDAQADQLPRRADERDAGVRRPDGELRPHEHRLAAVPVGEHAPDRRQDRLRNAATAGGEPEPDRRRPGSETPRSRLMKRGRNG